MANNNDQLIAAYVILANQLVGSKVATDSIDPTDVAALGIELAELLLPILNTINDFAITGGTLPPDNGNGVDLDLYIQGGATLNFWRKRNGAWIQVASVPLGIQIVDGNITLRASVNDMIVTVSAGTWGINNIIYSKATQTQLTLTAADLNFNRIDTIVADNTSSIYLLDGIASSNPNPAALPANSIVVDYVYVPASSSGDLPYISDSNSPVSGVSALTFTQANLVYVYDQNYSLSFNIPDGKSIASIETKAGTKTKYIDISQAVTDTANSPNTIIEGFDNNAAQTITIKLI